jgi:hypothetical protein
VSFKRNGSFMGGSGRKICEYMILLRMFIFSCLVEVYVNIVDTMKKMLCVVAQMEEIIYVMHAASFGRQRLVILLTSMVSMKCLVQLLYVICSTTTIKVFYTFVGVGCIGQTVLLCYAKIKVFWICHIDLN